MQEPLKKAGAAVARVSDFNVTSVSAVNEPESHRGKAYADLAAGLPTAEACRAAGISIEAIATTPDFHPGKPVPVGVVADISGGVLPHLVGNDIGCGMRMIVVDGVSANELPQSLTQHLRHLFFQGGRDIALTGRNRRALLIQGFRDCLKASARAGRGFCRNWI